LLPALNKRGDYMPSHTPKERAKKANKSKKKSFVLFKKKPKGKAAKNRKK